MADLLKWVADNGLKLTGGYRTPERNREVGGVPNSYHTRGDAQHPGAVDIDHRGVDLAWLRAHVPPGYEVIDERGKKGAPHFHIEPGNSNILAQAAPKKNAPRLYFDDPKHQQGLQPVSAPPKPPASPFPTRDNVQNILKQADDVLAQMRQGKPAQTIQNPYPQTSGTLSRTASPAYNRTEYSKPSTMNPIQSAWQGFQQPFNPYASTPEGFSGAAGEFAGRAALPVLAGLSGGGIPLIAAAGAATGAIREDSRQRRYNEAPDLGKIGLSASTESLVAAPFLGKAFIPNALMGGGVAAAQSAADQYNSTGQVDAGRTLQDATAGGLLSGGLGKLFGHAPVQPGESPNGFIRPGQREAAASLEAQKQSALKSAAQEQIDLANRAEILKAKAAQDAYAMPRQLTGGTGQPLQLPGGTAAEAPKLLPGSVEVQTPGGGILERPSRNLEPIPAKEPVPAPDVVKGVPYEIPPPETIQPSPFKPEPAVFAKKGEAKDAALALSKETGIPHEVTTSGGMHFAHPVGENAGLETVKVPRGAKVTLDGEEFTLQGQAGGKVKLKNATGERIVDEALIQKTTPDPVGIPDTAPKVPETPPIAPDGLAPQEALQNVQPEQPAIPEAANVPETPQIPEPASVPPSQEDVKARLSRGNIVAPGDPEAITSLADLKAKKPGLYEGLSPTKQAVTNKILDAIQTGEVLEAPYLPKKGDTAQIGTKAFRPSHLSAAGNTLEVFGTNIEGRTNRLIIHDYREPNAKWGFQEVPRASNQVVPAEGSVPREAITPRVSSEATISQVKKLSEIAPNNRTIQNAVKILEKDNLTVKDVIRAKKALEDGSVSDKELRTMMEELKKTEGASNCG